MKAKCSVFKNSFSPECNYEVPTLRVLDAIKEGRWKDLIEKIRGCEDKDTRNELKKSLPCATFSGTFNHRRQEKNIKSYSQLMVVDIDNLKPNELKRFKASLKEDPFIICFFESPSRGLKALVEVNSELEDHKGKAFPYVQEYFKDAHGITIDKSGKDVSRLCYVSYDPELYYTEDYDVFDVPTNFESITEKKSIKYFQSLRDNISLSESTDSNYVFETCKKWVVSGSVGGYHKGNRNNFIHALACCLNRAGMHEETATSLIGITYQSLKMAEIQQTVGSAYRHGRQEFGTRPILVKKSNQKSIF